MPSAIAPGRHEHDLAARRASARRSASAQRATAAWSRPRPSLVTRLEPTLTTMRRASATIERPLTPSPAAARRAALARERTGAGVSTSGVPVGGAGSPRGAARMRVEPLLDRVDERAAAVADDRRDREHRALVAHRLDERGDARLALVLGHEVELVEHEPARLLRERRIVLARAPSTIALASRTGSASGSNGAMSTTCSSRRVRCRWRRKWWPRPAPSAAPSMSPGMSATTKLRLSSVRTTPRFGASVVNG